MIQASVAAPEHARPQPDTRETDCLDPLLRLAGDLGSARTLVVAAHGLGLICGLIRSGCPAASTARPGDKPDAGDYDVMIAPDVTAPDDTIRLARHALRPNGRLVAGAGDPKSAAALARRLRLNGFSGLRSIHLPGQILLRADLRRPA